MEITEDGKTQKHRKKSRHCMGKLLLPYENDNVCVACAYNVMKRNHELSKISWKKI